MGVIPEVLLTGKRQKGVLVSEPDIFFSVGIHPDRMIHIVLAHRIFEGSRHAIAQPGGMDMVSTRRMPPPQPKGTIKDAGPPGEGKIP